MDTLGLLFALLLPYAIGDALLAACVRDGRAWREPGIFPWLAGAAWIVGTFLLTLVMRGVAMAGLPFSVASIGVPGLAIVAAAGLLAWRRNGEGWRDTIGIVRDGVAARDLAGAARAAWFVLLAWLALRAAMLLVEVVERPIYPWDAWSAWATKAKVYFAERTIVPFGDAAQWMAAAPGTWYDAAPGQPATLPLVQAWIATAMGRFDDARVTLPWWLWFVALLLVTYGEARRRGVGRLPSLAAAWFAGSLPLMGAQVALAGYADLPTAAAFTLGALAGARAVRTRAPVDALAATLALAAAASMKTSGWVWVVIALPGLAAAALGPAWTRRIAIAIPALAVGVVAVGARFTDLSIGPVSLAFDPVFAALGTDGVLLANWHLLALGAVGTIVFAWRRLLDPAVAPLTLVVATGAAWIGLLGAFPWLRNWGADSLGLNRVVLALAPVVSIWMVVALHAARTPQRQPAVEPMGA
ncbi:MAG: hypothetical protein IT519_03055 [Burkholderiales bacterium]|nr:hypothetical protein [Burkholderiales bacterium]